MKKFSKILFVLWSICAVVFVVGMVLYQIGTKTNVYEINLAKDNEVKVSCFRLKEGNLHLRAALKEGIFTSEELNPNRDGKEVLVEFQVLKDDEKRYKIVKNSYSHSEGKNFFYIEPENGKTNLDVGSNDFEIKVLKVSDRLLNEQASIYISSEIPAFKFVPNDTFYKFVWLFHFWMIGLTILVVWFVICLFLNKKYK